MIFGSMEVALKIAGSAFDSFQITFIRFFVGGIVLIPFAIREFRSMPKGYMTLKLWLYVFMLGALNVCVSMVFFQIGVEGLNASTAGVIICSNPIFIMLIAHMTTTDEKINRYKALALVLGAAGLTFMIRPWEMQEGNTPAGMFFLLAAAVTFALYSVLGGKTVARVGVFTQTSVSFLFGSLVLLCMLPVLGRPIIDGVAENIGILLYISVVVTGAGFLLYFLAIKQSNATTASIVFFLKPVIAPILAVLIIGDVITYNMYIGIALILAASYILIFRK